MEDGKMLLNNKLRHVTGKMEWNLQDKWSDSTLTTALQQTVKRY